MKNQHPVTLLCICILALALCGSLLAAEDGKSFSLSPDDHGVVLKTPDGRVIFRYMTSKPEGTNLTANSVCCLYPVMTPSGKAAVEFAPSDHPHHRGIFLAWHAIEGPKPADFWGWGEFAPTEGRVIENREGQLVSADAKQATIRVRNDWRAGGDVLIEETTTIAASECEGAYVIDLDFGLLPKADLTLRQTAFGGLCIKSWKDGEAAYTSPDGEVALPPPHHLKPETDWPSKAWYDYTVRREAGHTLGVAVIDHPGNPKTMWHNLKPIAMVNPCIVAPGPVSLRAGRVLRLRYRLVVHDGPPPVELLARLSKEWREE